MDHMWSVHSINGRHPATSQYTTGESEKSRVIGVPVIDAQRKVFIESLLFLGRTAAGLLSHARMSLAMLRARCLGAGAVGTPLVLG